MHWRASAIEWPVPLEGQHRGSMCSANEEGPIPSGASTHADRRF